MEKIKGYFKNKPYVKIHIMPSQKLNIETGMNRAVVTEIYSNGDIYYKHGATSVVCRVEHDALLPADALLIILDELGRMKKGNQLKKS